MKTLTSLLLVFLAIALCLTLGCGGSSTQPTPKQAVTDIYAAGYEENDARLDVAKYWKNGHAVTLGDGVKGSYASAIAVSGNDVYAAGVEANGDHVVAKYWKNGVKVDLTDGTRQSFAHSIFVSGHDVYVAGEEWDPPNPTVAKYWKNGVPVVLQDGQGAWAILVVGSDVYVAGSRYKTTQIDPTHSVVNRVAMYWKNGVPVELTGGLAPAEAYSIFVSKTGDIYVGGWACATMDPGCARATYWKNDVPTQLTDTPDTDIVSILVSGTDIYAAGNQNNSLAVVWKNQELTPLPSDFGPSGANQIALSDGDVYVAGGYYGATGKAVAGYWKNGVVQPITNGTNHASAYAIAVVKH